MRTDLWLKLIDYDSLSLDFVSTHIARSDIYLASDLEPDYNLSEIRKHYAVVPKGPLFKILPMHQGHR